MGGGRKNRVAQPDEYWQQQGHGRIPGEQGLPSAASARFLDGIDKEAILVMEKEGTRNYIVGETIVLGEAAGDWDGVTLRAYIGAKDAAQVKRYDLHPNSYKLVPFAAMYTRRYASGEAINPKIQACEELGPDLECFRCRCKTGVEVRRLNGTTYNRRACHFVVNHTKIKKPSWFKTKRKGVIAQQLKNGDAEVLCLRCDAVGTHSTRPGQGTSHNNKIVPA